MTEQEKNEFLLNAITHLLRRYLAYYSFAEWVLNQSEDHRKDLEKILANCRREVEKEPGLESKLRSIAVSALQSGEANLDQALTSFLKEWTPKGKPN